METTKRECPCCAKGADYLSYIQNDWDSEMRAYCVFCITHGCQHSSRGVCRRKTKA